MPTTQHYTRPQSLEEALELVHGGRAVFLAGGTTLAQHPDSGVATLVDIMGLGLDGVESTPAGLRLGATAPLERLRRHESVRALGDGALSQALERTRTPAWRNQATLGGRLCEASPDDLVTTTLLALDATMTVCDAPRAPLRTLPLGEAPHLSPGALILHIDVPPSAGWSCALEGLWISAMDPAIAAVTVAARVERDVVAALRVSTCGLTPHPTRLPAVEAALHGAGTDADWGPALQELADTIQPVTDFRATGAYRSHVGKVLLGRALRRVLARASS